MDPLVILALCATVILALKTDRITRQEVRS